jgi:hypothetical protein
MHRCAVRMRVDPPVEGASERVVRHHAAGIRREARGAHETHGAAARGASGPVARVVCGGRGAAAHVAHGAPWRVVPVVPGARVGLHAVHVARRARL